MMFIKYAAFHLQQLGAKKQKEREAQLANNEIEAKVRFFISYKNDLFFIMSLCLLYNLDDFSFG